MRAFIIPLLWLNHQISFWPPSEIKNCHFRISTCIWKWKVYSLFENQKKQYLFCAVAGIFFPQQMLPQLCDVIIYNSTQYFSYLFSLLWNIDWKIIGFLTKVKMFLRHKLFPIYKAVTFIQHISMENCFKKWLVEDTHVFIIPSEPL